LYGWQVFDRILARLSEVLQDAVGKALPRETLLGINGVAGDRFVAFVIESDNGAEADHDYLAKVDADLRAALDDAVDHDEFVGLSPRLTFRTGFSLLGEDPFYRFERLVYGAVDEARNLSSRRDERREQSWGTELKRIIQDSAVTTVFQPVVDLGTREVFGFEALTRGPKDSVFEMPRAMFALSLRVGVAVDLDRLCRDTALKSWGRSSGRGKVFVNILAGSLDDPAWLAGGLGGLLEAASLQPTDVVIEVSERSAESAMERFAAVTERLKEQGFGVALDDVGTGYATLTTLEKVRPDYLKVDVSMVRDIHRNLIKQDLLSSLVQIGRRIDASVIAEGVESEDEAAALLNAGAAYAQGYLFAAPRAMGPDPNTRPGTQAAKRGTHHEH
jgi:EAL domain-containing protein (putative c-di-GMP-specific phosphodiesterase class I)